MNKEFISEQFLALQAQIVRELEEIDGVGLFSVDRWEREEGGGGRTQTIANGQVLEKGGVAFSAVHGAVSETMKKQLQLDGESFYATGVSIVLHPKHPFVPIIHMNVRYFELNDGTYWFGGGIDLTPHYVDEEAAQKFHQNLKTICDEFNPEFYSKFKPWADDYFYIPHRNETRGIGGIFFDHLDATCGIGKEQIFEFCLKLGQNFPRIYGEQVALGIVQPFNEENSNWQNHRRGRYVEFNLVNDKGTKFGLFSGGRTESILMSLPPLANWTYCLPVKKNSIEAKTLKKLIKGVDWLK
ncbi:MAG: oxygen-dependent coproporphyrinogen oxidase [Crocinitomicaceae bacterium]